MIGIIAIVSLISIIYVMFHLSIYFYIFLFLIIFTAYFIYLKGKSIFLHIKEFSLHEEFFSLLILKDKKAGKNLSSFLKKKGIGQEITLEEIDEFHREWNYDYDYIYWMIYDNEIRNKVFIFNIASDFYMIKYEFIKKNYFILMTNTIIINMMIIFTSMFFNLFYNNLISMIYVIIYLAILLLTLYNLYEYFYDSKKIINGKEIISLYIRSHFEPCEILLRDLDDLYRENKYISLLIDSMKKAKRNINLENLILLSATNSVDNHMDIVSPNNVFYLSLAFIIINMSFGG